MRVEASLELDAGVAAPRLARRFVREQLTRWGCSELGDIASLCVSEIVTNALFHAGPSIALRMHWDSQVLRVEVHDQSPDSAIPTAVVAAVGEEDLWGSEESLADATSGRGLFVVASVAKVLGEQPVDGGAGKIVWFELDLDSLRAAGPVELGTIVQQLPPEPGSGNGTTVVLRDVPVAEAIASDTHIDGIVRELQLLAPGNREIQFLVDAIRAARGVLPFFAPVREQLLIHSLRSVESTDVTIEVSADVAAAVPQLPEALDAVDRLDDSGLLLTLPASGPIRQWRRRLVAEVRAQLEG